MSAWVRQLVASDLASVMQIQAACYPPHYLEAESVFAERIANCSASAWLAGQGQQVLGYLFSYPSQSGKVCALDSVFAAQPGADCLYLHDMAVLPQAQGQGIARALHQSAMHYAQQQQYACSALVAVLDAASFWQKLGYRADFPLSPAQQENLLSYGTTACYLHKALKSAQV